MPEDVPTNFESPVTFTPNSNVWSVADIFRLSSGETVVAGNAPMNEQPQAEPGSRWQLLQDDVPLVEFEASHPRMPGQDKSVWTVSTTDPFKLPGDEQASIKAGRVKLRQAGGRTEPQARE